MDILWAASSPWVMLAADAMAARNLARLAVSKSVMDIGMETTTWTRTRTTY